jgi:hypothetical protein
VIGPRVGADRDRVAAMEIRAIDQDAAHASFAHFSEGDLLRAGAALDCGDLSHSSLLQLFGQHLGLRALKISMGANTQKLDCALRHGFVDQQNVVF